MSDIDREEELVDGPEVWSVSKLQTMQTCGRKYKLRYVDRVPEEKGVALKFGSVVHQFIDNIHKNRFEDIGELQEKFVDSWKSSKIWDWSDELMSPLQYKNRGLKMLEKYWKDHRDDKVVESEVRFTCNTPSLNVSLRGIIDKIQEIEPGVYGIVDFKTSKNPPDWTVLRRDLQLTAYHLAAASVGFDINYVAIHHLLSGEVYWSWRDKNDIPDLEEALYEARYKASSDMFARNIDHHCRWCSFKEKCLGLGGSTS